MYTNFFFSIAQPDIPPRWDIDAAMADAIEAQETRLWAMTPDRFALELDLVGDTPLIDLFADLSALILDAEFPTEDWLDVRDLPDASMHRLATRYPHLAVSDWKGKDQTLEGVVREAASRIVARRLIGA